MMSKEDRFSVQRYSWGNVWYKNGTYHREDGPAIEYNSGEKFWFLNGKRHREDGPSIDFSDADDQNNIKVCQWWINGIRLTELQFKQQYRDKRLKKLLS